MELNDALRRVVGQHRRLVGACLAAGLILGILFAPHAKEYAASARLVLDTPDPASGVQSAVIADTARAIATSPSLVRRALVQAGVPARGASAFARQNVSVTSLGTSSVLEVSVTARSPRAAAAIANALAELLIRTRTDITNGQTQQALADLDRRSSELNRRISAADELITSLSLQIANAKSSAEANALRAKRNETQSRRDLLAQQRSVLESEQVSLLSASAQRPRPAIISAAAVPGRPASSHRLPYMVLGALLGLILGLGGAGLVETLRPTLVGSDTVAAEFDAPLLGTFTSHPSAAEATTIGARLRLAADAAELGSVALLPAQSHLDFEPLAQALNASPSVGGAATNGNGGDDGHRRALHVVPFRAENPPANNGRRSGLVVVSPTVLKKRDLTAIPHLLRATHLPLVGVITYAEPRTGAAAAIKDKVARLVEAVT